MVDPAKGVGNNMWLGKNVKIKRTENFFFHFSPLLGKKKKLKKYVGGGKYK